MKVLIVTIFALSGLIGCTWVNENKAGRDVAVATTNQIVQCQSKGRITAKVKSKVGFYNRSKTKVLEELQILARNEAVKLGANTIVAQGDPVEGSQIYQAYSCP